MQVAVCADVSTWARRTARRVRGAPCTVVLKLAVAEATVPRIEGPDQGIGLGVRVCSVRELVGPHQRSRGDVGRITLAGDGAGCNARGCGDGLDRQVRGHQEGRLVLLRRSYRRAAVEGVVNGGSLRCGSQAHHNSAVLHRYCGDGGCSRLVLRLSSIPTAGACAAAASAQQSTRQDHRCQHRRTRRHWESPDLRGQA